MEKTYIEVYDGLKKVSVLKEIIKFTKKDFIQPNASDFILNAVRQEEGKASETIIPEDLIVEFFKLPNVTEIALEYVKHGHKFSEYAQFKVFKLPNAAEIIFEYVKHEHKLCGYAQIEVFKLPNAAEIILECVKHGHELDKCVHSKIFTLSNVGDIMLEYAKHGWILSNDAQYKVFKLPNANEIMLEYTKHYVCLSGYAQLKIFNLPDADEIVYQCLQNGSIYTEDALLKLLDLPYAEALMSIPCDKKQFTIFASVREKISKMPNADEIVRQVGNSFLFDCDELQKKLNNRESLSEEELKDTLEMHRLIQEKVQQRWENLKIERNDFLIEQEKRRRRFNEIKEKSALSEV